MSATSRVLNVFSVATSRVAAAVLHARVPEGMTHQDRECRTGVSRASAFELPTVQMGGAARSTEPADATKASAESDRFVDAREALPRRGYAPICGKCAK